eukprot:scaffold13950_cov24-Phaeocystis_antarctica.AAC.2
MKQRGVTILSSGMRVARPYLSETECRKRKPRPLPPSEPLPNRAMLVAASAECAFSTPEASLLRWARVSERIQFRSQSARSRPCSPMA